MFSITEHTFSSGQTSCKDHGASVILFLTMGWTPNNELQLSCSSWLVDSCEDARHYSQGIGSTCVYRGLTLLSHGSLAVVQRWGKKKRREFCNFTSLPFPSSPHSSFLLEFQDRPPPHTPVVSCLQVQSEFPSLHVSFISDVQSFYSQLQFCFEVCL